MVGKPSKLGSFQNRICPVCALRKWKTLEKFFISIGKTDYSAAADYKGSAVRCENCGVIFLVSEDKD